MYFDRSSMGNPQRLLDTRQRTAKADKTYEVLSGLASAAIGVSKIVQEEHNVEMERRAKNDLVNNTINPDLQRHERIYATTVAKGQALDSFRDIRNRIQTGEFDSMEPLEFQETMNKIHAQKAEEYSASRFSDEATGAWNDFWVNQESTLTAGQAGKYRVALKDKQQTALSQNIIGKYNTGNYSGKDILNELSSDDYSMLNTDNIVDVALEAGATIAAQGDNTLLEVLNNEFDFANDPERYKTYDMATKVAHRKQRAVANERVMLARTAFLEAKDSGTLTPDMYKEEIVPGVKLNQALDLEGNRVVSDKEFAQGLVQSKSNFVKNRQFDKGVELLAAGQNLVGVVNNKTAQESFNILARDLLQKTDDPLTTFHELGKIATRQSINMTFFENFGGSFASLPLYEGNEVSENVVETFMSLGALKQGYANDAKFYKALGPDGAARFKALEYESFYTAGSPEDKLRGAIKKVSEAQEAKDEGLVRNITTIPEDVQEVIQEEAKDYLAENNRFFRIDSVQDYGTRDFEQYVGQRFKDYVNKYNMNPKAAIELAVEDVKGVTEEWDGALVFTGGAALDLGESNEYTIKTLQNDPDIAEIIAAEYSSGLRYDLRKDPGLVTPAKPKKIPDWDEVRTVPDYTNNRILFLDSKDRMVHQIPVEHVKMLNEARKQYVWPVWDKVRRTFGKVWVTQEEYDQSITEQDIEE